MTISIPEQNVKLRTYAEYRIRGAILDSLRASDWAPRMKRKLARTLEAGLARAEQRWGRVPEEAEIAAELGIPVEEYRQKLGEVAALDIGELEFLRDERETPILLASREPTPDEDSFGDAARNIELGRLIAAVGHRPDSGQWRRTVLSLCISTRNFDAARRLPDMCMGIHFFSVYLKSSRRRCFVCATRSGQRWPGACGGGVS